MKPLFLLLVLLVPGLARAQSPFVSGAWSGNVTSTSATSAIHLTTSGLKVRWVVSESSTLFPAVYSATVTTTGTSGNVVKIDIDGLKSNTAYFYGYEVNGTLRPEATSRGQFRTFPQGASSFKIAFASCGDFRMPDQSAYDAIRAEKPLLFINTGDLHYSDTGTTNPADYRANYDAVLQHANQGALYREIPMAYMWDDHDFAGNDSDGSSAGRDAARRVYGEYVPHYPTRVPDGTVGQAFTIGRVRVILTDLRSGSSSISDPDSAAKSHLGTAQKAWFKQELIAARDAGCPLILWASPTPWIGTAGSGDDDWSIYAVERREIANFIRANAIRNVVLLCGDMHALAYDDGTHSDYADGGGAPLVVLHAAALTSGGSAKGGPYTKGPFPGSQQYGVVEITDTGGPAVSCRFTGKHAGEGARLSYEFKTAAAQSFAAPIVESVNSPNRAFVNVSSRDRITTVDGSTIVGFVIAGTSPRTVLLRAAGPSLKALGVSDALVDPKFSVHQGKTTIASNDDWADGGAAGLAEIFSRVGAFAFPDVNSKDSALVLTLDPGVYSVVARSANAGVGSVLIEVYDVQ